MGVAPTHMSAGPMAEVHSRVTVVHYRIPPSGLGPPAGVYFSGPFCQLYRGVCCDRRRSHQFGLAAFNHRFPADLRPDELTVDSDSRRDPGARRATIHALEPLRPPSSRKVPVVAEDSESLSDSARDEKFPDSEPCTVCLKNPPKEPVVCGHCKKVIACRGCLHTWFVSINSDPANASTPAVDFGTCLLCRHKWKRIVRQPGGESFKML